MGTPHSTCGSVSRSGAHSRHRAAQAHSKSSWLRARRNQLYLDHEVAGIWRPHAVSGRVQHSRAPFRGRAEVDLGFFEQLHRWSRTTSTPCARPAA